MQATPIWSYLVISIICQLSFLKIHSVYANLHKLLRGAPPCWTNFSLMKTFAICIALQLQSQFGRAGTLQWFCVQFKTSWFFKNCQCSISVQTIWTLNNFKKSLKAQRLQDLYKSNDNVDKCDLFYSMITNALEAIPFTFVELFANKKLWITPTLKLLINMCFEAYRQGNLRKYSHLKLKVRNKIEKVKKN